MASKRKVNLDDYHMTTTLGTGKFLFQQSPIKSPFMNHVLTLYSFRFFWSCASC